MPDRNPSKIPDSSPARGRQGVSIRDIIPDLARGWETMRKEPQFPQGSRAVGSEAASGASAGSVDILYMLTAVGLRGSGSTGTPLSIAKGEAVRNECASNHAIDVVPDEVLLRLYRNHRS